MALPQQEPEGLIDEDQEIIEIFVEEAEEVLGTIGSYFPAWVDNEADEEALSEIRRAFHTLKGSGRMVKASQIGELAWSIENMLNKLISGTVNRSQALLDLVDNVRQVMPKLVEAFQNKQTAALVGVDVELLIRQAEALAQGEEIAQISTTAPVAESDAETAETEPPELTAEQSVTVIDEVTYQKDFREVNDRVDMLSAAIDDILVSLDRVTANAANAVAKMEAESQGKSYDAEIKVINDKLNSNSVNIQEMRTELSTVSSEEKKLDETLSAFKSSVDLQVKSNSKRADTIRAELQQEIQLARSAFNQVQGNIIAWSLGSSLVSSLIVGGVVYYLLK